MSPIPPDRAQILSRLQRLAIGKVPINPTSMQPEAKLSEIGLDSFSLIELIFLAEEEFDIKIPIEGTSVKTVGDVLDLIAERVEPLGAS